MRCRIGIIGVIIAAAILGWASAPHAQFVPPVVFSSGASNPTLSFTADVTLTGGAGGIASGRTYTSVAIGTAGANRTIIVVDGFRDAGSCPLASMTIGGVSATRVAQQINSVTNTTIMSVWVAAVPTGTTATIVTVYCGSVDSAEGLGVYAAYGLVSSTPTATAGSSSSTAPSLNLNVSAGGMVVAGAWALGQTTTIGSWTGLTSDFNLLTDPTSTSQYQGGASGSNLAGATPRTVSLTYGTTSTGEASAIAAAFR